MSTAREYVHSIIGTQSADEINEWISKNLQSENESVVWDFASFIAGEAGFDLDYQISDDIVELKSRLGNIHAVHVDGLWEMEIHLFHLDETIQRQVLTIHDVCALSLILSVASEVFRQGGVISMNEARDAVDALVKMCMIPFMNTLEEEQWQRALADGFFLNQCEMLVIGY